MEKKLCTVCNKLKDQTAFIRKDGKVRKHTCNSCISRRYRVKLKLDMIKALGNVCECCGESNPYFLTLDHRNNDGNIHRQKLAAHQCIAEARREGFPREKYQLLCSNCNFAKGHYGECPHKLGLDSTQLITEFEKLSKPQGKIRQNYNTEANLAGLEKARAQLKENRIARGHYGRDQATRSREYRERHPEYKDRKQLQRLQKKLNSFPPEQLQAFLKNLPSEQLGTTS